MLDTRKGFLVICLALTWLSNEPSRSEKGVSSLAYAKASEHQLSNPPSCVAHQKALDLLHILQSSEKTSSAPNAFGGSTSARREYQFKHGLQDDSAWSLGGHEDPYEGIDIMGISLTEIVNVLRRIWGKLAGLLVLPLQFIAVAFSKILGVDLPGAELLEGFIPHSPMSRGRPTSAPIVAIDPAQRSSMLREVAGLLDNATVHADEVDWAFWRSNPRGKLLDEETGLPKVEGCDEAWSTRAMFHLLPPNGGEINVTKAIESLEVSSQLTSNATTQFLLGYINSAGLSSVPVNQAEALLHHTFAAFQSLPEAEIALGYHHLTGIGTKEDCLSSLAWYESAADKSYAKFINGPPGGRTLPMTSSRLSDLVGGVYGPGASWASTGMNGHRMVIKAGEKAAAGESLDEVLDYYQYQSDRGFHRYTAALGRIHYIGSVYSASGGISSGGEKFGAIGVDYDKSRTYFLKVARLMWPKDIKLTVGTDLPEDFGAKTGQASMTPDQFNDMKGPASTAAGYLGRMYLRGEGVQRDYLTARMWLKRGAELGDRESHNMLGIIYRDGLGVEKVPAPSVMKWFVNAAGAELADAKVNLGKLHLHMKQPEHAMGLFSQAVANGNPFESHYHIGKLHAATARSETPDSAKHSGVCTAAVLNFKTTVEKGRWAYPYLDRADQAWQDGEKTKALILWWIAAELGYEVAQNNVAYLLDVEIQQRDRQSRRRFSLKGLMKTIGVSGTSGKTASILDMMDDPDFAALTQWIRSAGQQNVDSLVKVGDYHYKGIGVGSPETALEEAASTYQSAAETQTSAMAFWNLGWMYENGLGVQQDWHLAKRFYDLCGQTNIEEAKLGVRLSLLKLRARTFWQGLRSGDLGGGSPEDRMDWKGFFGAQDSGVGQRLPAADVGEPTGAQATDGFARVTAEDREAAELLEEYTLFRLAASVGGADADEDSDEGLERRERLLRLGIDPADVDDYLDHVARAHGVEDDDDLVEILIIIGLVGLLAGLVWLRNRWERERQAARMRAAGADRPVQPPTSASGMAVPVVGQDRGAEEIPVMPM